MLIETKKSKLPGKTYELRSGSNGQGREVLMIFTIKQLATGGTTTAWIETFINHAEANNWFKHACS